MSDSTRGRILWYELMTTDMEAAEDFYTKVVGWSVQPFEGTPEPYHMFVRQGGMPSAGLMKIPPGITFPPHWEMYVGVDKLEDAVAHIKRLGGDELGPLVQVPTVGRMQTMTDAQQAVFAIYESESPQPPEEPRQVGEASWHELMTTDAEAAMKFYTELFGWKPTTSMDMGPMGTYHMFGGKHELGGMMNKPQELAHVPPHWGIYFKVPDVDAAAEKIKAHGGQVLNGPMEVPGGSRIVNAMDPQGAAFSLHADKK